MNDLKQIIAKNLVELRKRKKYTQLDLANTLQYSDKAISKWEKGDSLPDIEVLYQICNLYGVTLDFLTHEGSFEEKKEYVLKKDERKNKVIITALFVSIIWLIAIIFFCYIIFVYDVIFWPIYVWAAPGTFGVLIFFNSLWGKKKWNVIVVSLFIWTFLASVHVQFIYFNQNVWPIYLIGIPLQVATILIAQLHKS